MRINNNIMSLNAHRQLGVNQANGAKSMERLSSGLRINRAGDDAAGLAISEKMRGQIRGLNQASRNAQDGISLIQTAEGGLNETHAILQRMNELATQAATDTNEGIDRTAIQQEITDLAKEIDRIADVTHFNNRVLLDGNLGVQLDAASTLAVGTDGVTNINISGANASTTYTLTFAAGTYTLTDGTTDNVQNLDLAEDTAGTLNFDHLGVTITLGEGANSTELSGGTVVTDGTDSIKLQIGSKTSLAEEMSVSIADMTSSGLGVDTLNVESFDTAQSAMDAIQTAIDTVSTQRSELGAMQNRLEYTISNLGTSAENLQAAESRIRDLDMAAEMMDFTKNNILQQAATAMLAQANMAPQSVLQLLG